MAYRFGVSFRKLGAALAVLAVVLAAGATTGEARPDVTTQLTLDRVAFRPELARTPEDRMVGLMFRKRAPVDGMLFVFSEDTNGGFWMKNTLVPLKIVFFDRRGRQVKRMLMKPCLADPCRTYEPGVDYRFALELPATDRRRARLLGPLAKITRLSARSG